MWLATSYQVSEVASSSVGIWMQAVWIQRVFGDSTLTPFLLHKNVYFRSAIKSASSLKPEVFWNSEVSIFRRRTQHIHYMLVVGQLEGIWDRIKHTNSSSTEWVFILNKVKTMNSQRTVPLLPSEVGAKRRGKNFWFSELGGFQNWRLGIVGLQLL